MSQRPLKKKTSAAVPCIKRQNKPQKPKQGFLNPAAAKVRKNKSVVGIDLIEGKLANVVIGNNENIKFVTPKERRGKKTRI